MHAFQTTTHSVSETIALGRALAVHLRPGDVLAISGNLGAGKTHFCKGIARGLDVDPDVVNSPTFVLMQQYAGRIPVLHFDTYRLSGVEEFEDIGGPEFLDGDGISLIEWPDRVADALPQRTLQISIEATSATDRRISLEDTGPRATEVARQLRQGTSKTR